MVDGEEEAEDQKKARANTNEPTSGEYSSVRDLELARKPERASHDAVIAVDRFAHILLVEDEPVHLRWLTDAFGTVSVAHQLHIVSYSEEALEFLRQEDSLSPLPDLILIDLELRQGNAMHLLHEIKADPELRRIPVICLLGSDIQEEALRAYDGYANVCIRKPMDGSQWNDIVGILELHWLVVARLPYRRGR